MPAVTGASVWAAPVIENLSLRGLQSGATTLLTIDGRELGPDVKLLLPVPLASQEVQEGATPQRVQIAVALDASVPSGIYPLRVVGPGGASNAVAVGIDPLPQLPFAEQIESLPASLHGKLEGAAVLRTTLPGKKGERLVIEVEGQRLGSKINPVLRLEDSRGVQLAYSPARQNISGDARIDLELPEDGTYRVVLHDAIYQGPSPGFFRLKIGQFYYADFVLPLAARRGTRAEFEFASTNIPPDQRPSADAPPLAHRALAPWPALSAISGRRPQFVVSDFDEVVETPSAGIQEIASLPVGISGRLSAPGEEDVYQLKVEPGMKLRIDVLAERIGSPIDGVLSVRNLQGGQLAQSDDRPNTTDPGLDFNVPAGVEAIRLVLKDLTGRGGPECVYRIVVKPVDRGDFQLSVAGDRFDIPRGGAALVRVEANRQGYSGPIKLHLPNLPPGVEVRGAEIPQGATQALVSLAAAEGASDFGAGVLVGSSDDEALVRSAVLAAGEPWQLNQIALAVTAPGPLAPRWQGVSDDLALVQGGKVKASVQVQRGEGAGGPLRLSLVTSQPVPKKTVKQDNKDVTIDDVEKMLRLEGPPTLAEGASETEVTLLVPATLPALPYDVAVRAELLSDDGKQVRLSGTSAAVRLQTTPPAADQPRLVFEDQEEFIAQLTDGKGEASLHGDDKYSGSASVKVTPDGRLAASLPGLGVAIREFPEPGQYRYLRFAWKKQGGQAICIQLNHDGAWGPQKDKPGKFRYHAGPGPECFGASVAVDQKLPGEWAVVTRDLFADFGEFTLDGLALSPVDGEFGLFDHIYLGRHPVDFDLVKPQAP